MNQKITYTFMTNLNFCILIVILLSVRCSCDHYYNEVCVTKSCGYGPNISYPFYISGLQQPFCGYDGFELRCNEHGYPILHLRDNDYIVEQIFYDNSSLRVYNAAVESFGNGCLPQIGNTTLANTPFRFDNVSYFNFLSNCNTSLPGELLKYKVGCDNGDGEYSSGLAMFDKDENLDYALTECKRNVVAPVEVYEEDGNGVVEGYQELMRRGFVLNWTATDCSECRASGGRCGFNEANHRFMCYCPDRLHFVSCKPTGSHKFRLILGIVASTCGVAILTVIVFCLRRKYSIFNFKRGQHQNVELLLKNYGSLAPKRYHYSDIKKMTSSFKIRLGQGGFGSVYKGKLCDGSLVAVKVLNDTNGNGEEFINEVASISRTSHVNIVKLLGFCFEGTKRALIYEFMPNGSLEKFIYEKKSLMDRQLGWQTLYKIAVGIARGLEYLHCRCNTQIVHFDIKPHNILLDEQFSPKISDFGLSKLSTQTNVSILGARGTIGYIAPEVVCRNVGGVSHKSDVYSYGMMILEMVGGRKNVDAGVNRTSEIYYPHWIYKQLELNEKLGFDGVLDEEENEKARNMVIVSLWCIQTDPSTRPSMTKVLEMLEGNLESLQIPPKPYLYSPSRSPVESSSVQIT